MSRVMKSVLLLLCFTVVGCGLLRAQSSEFDKATHTKVGDRMPAFTVREVSGKTFSMAQERGKVVLVNFWATWCGPCQIEMPRIEKEIWEKDGSRPDFAMVAIAREQTKDVVAGFERHHAYRFPLAYDPDRAVYKRFADMGIPRNYVVGRDGKILFQSVGYEPGEFDSLKKALQKALATR